MAFSCPLLQSSLLQSHLNILGNRRGLLGRQREAGVNGFRFALPPLRVTAWRWCCLATRSGQRRQLAALLLLLFARSRCREPEPLCPGFPPQPAACRGCSGAPSPREPPAPMGAGTVRGTWACSCLGKLGCSSWPRIQAAWHHWAVPAFPITAPTL